MHEDFISKQSDLYKVDDSESLSLREIFNVFELNLGVNVQFGLYL